MDNHTLLIERIGLGWYDDKLEVLFKNAEKTTNYPVWKALEARREIAGVGQGYIIPTRYLMDMSLPKGILCGICAPSLRVYAAEIGEMLIRLGRSYNMDIGFQPSHIRACSFLGLDALQTRVGQRTHNVTFYTVREKDAVFYVVEVIHPGFQKVRTVYQQFKEAETHLKQEVEDECFLEDW